MFCAVDSFEVLTLIHPGVNGMVVRPWSNVFIADPSLIPCS